MFLRETRSSQDLDTPSSPRWTNTTPKNNKGLVNLLYGTILLATIVSRYHIVRRAKGGVCAHLLGAIFWLSQALEEVLYIALVQLQQVNLLRGVQFTRTSARGDKIGIISTLHTMKAFQWRVSPFRLFLVNPQPLFVAACVQQFYDPVRERGLIELCSPTSNVFYSAI